MIIVFLNEIICNNLSEERILLENRSAVSHLVLLYVKSAD